MKKVFHTTIFICLILLAGCKSAKVTESVMPVENPTTDASEITGSEEVLDVIDSSLPFYRKIQGHVFDSEGNIPDNEAIEKDYYLIFYGADWCPYCKAQKKFINTFYNEYKKKFDNFEIILAGSNKDKSNDDLVLYMNNEKFSFCRIDYKYRSQLGVFSFPEMENWEKFYIPAMLLIDKNGNVISSSNMPSKADYNFSRPIEEYIIRSEY